ncbi:MAG: glycosyltransferase family 4 protein [Promethearchaeota archaeon]|jgi:glycosyltransferase involved in cell wall biosynthesis
MKIVVATSGGIPSKFAHSFNVMKMAQGFFSLKNNVEVVAPLSLPILIKKNKIKDVHRFYGVDNRIKIKYIPVYSLKALRKSSNFWIFNYLAARYCKKRNVDLAYCRSYIIPYYCVKWNVPTIIETHTTVYNLPDFQKIYEIAKYPSLKGLVTISDEIKKEHVKRGIPEEKILVLEDGVDLERFKIKDDRYFWRKKLGLPTETKLVVYCGQLFQDKGIEHILLTAKELSKEDILFVLIGGFQKEISRWKLYCKKKLINNVFFRGFVNNSEVPKYLKAADVLIMPYKTNIDFIKMDINTTSPMKLFEYMASNRPIISTNIPTISKIVKHNRSALLAAPNNIEQLVNYVIELIENEKKSNKLAKNAFEDVKKHEWKKRCKKILENT